MARFAGGSEFMDAFNAVSGSGLNVGALTAAGQASQSRQRSNAMLQQARLKMAEDKAEVIEATADARAGMYGAQADASFNNSIMGGAMSAINTFAGGFGGGGGGGITSYDQIPAEGLRGAAAGGGPNAYFGTGGRYGTFVPPV